MCARDLNEWLRDRLRFGINGAFGVSGVNYNGRRVIEGVESKRVEWDKSRNFEQM